MSLVVEASRGNNGAVALLRTTYRRDIRGI